MLIALDAKKNRVCAFDVDKYDSKGNILKYYCPECGEELVLRKGSVYKHHFSHKSKTSNCSLRDGGGESDIHNFMKYKIKKIIEEDNNLIESEIEYPIGLRIADYYCTLKHKNKVMRIAVEIVYKHENIKDFVEKCEDYYNKEVYCIWIFNITKFTKKSSENNINNNINKIISRGGDFLEEVHVNEIMKNAHLFHYGMIYALDAINETIYSIHLESLFSNNPTKTFVYQLIDSFNISFFSKCNPDEFLDYNRCVAGPLIEKYWSKKPYDFLFKRDKDEIILEEDLFQSQLKKQFYNKRNICLGEYNRFEIVYCADNNSLDFINEEYLIFKNIREDYYYRCILSSKEDVLNFIKNRRIRISAKNIDELFYNLNSIMTLHGGGSFGFDSEINKVVNKKDFSEYDDLISYFSKSYKPQEIDEEFISMDEYLNIDKGEIKDLRIIFERDKYKLIELINDKKFLHGEFDSWEDADDVGRKL